MDPPSYRVDPPSYLVDPPSYLVDPPFPVEEEGRYPYLGVHLFLGDLTFYSV